MDITGHRVTTRRSAALRLADIALGGLAAVRSLGIMVPMTVVMESPMALVCVADEISSWNAADEIDDQVEIALSAGAAHVVIELSNVTYSDSLGVAALVRAGRRCRDRGVFMSVRNPAMSLRYLMGRSAEARSLVPIGA